MRDCREASLRRHVTLIVQQQYLDLFQAHDLRSCFSFLEGGLAPAQRAAQPWTQLSGAATQRAAPKTQGEADRGDD
jgi:hypothetical protein